jgi:hypothetical protein
VRKKFNIPENVEVKFVLESDGCDIDTADLPGILPLSDPLMVLWGSQMWSKVT